MTLYKILENGKSCHGGSLQWSLPNGKPGDWHEVSGPLDMCKNGIHLTEKPANWFRWNCSIYEAEYEGEILKDGDESKRCVRKARLIREVPAPSWWTKCHHFVERDIPSVKWLKPDLRPRKEWKLYKADSWSAAWSAARDAAWSAARDAAWSAARDAARSAAGSAAGSAAWSAAGSAAGDAAWSAAWDAAGSAAWSAAWSAAGDAAGSAAWDAAGDAARDAAWDAAGDAARDAAGDAALYSRVEYICDGLKIDKKHKDHIRKRWEVWQKGYALLCDVNGILYVYCKNTEER